VNIEDILYASLKKTCKKIERIELKPTRYSKSERQTKIAMPSSQRENAPDHGAILGRDAWI